MLEKVFHYSTRDGKAVERIIDDENIHLNHMVFGKGEGLPEHYSNSNVYMSVIRGILSIGLDDQNIHEYERGTILNIPFNTRMNVGNKHDGVLEIFVVKAPNPKDYAGGR